MVKLSIHEKEYVRKTVEEMEDQWEAYEKAGKGKEWFNEQFHSFVEYCFKDKERCRKDEEAYIACMKSHQVSDYSNEDLLQTIMDKGRMDVCCVYLAWYARNILGKPLIIYADSVVGERFMRELFVGEWTKNRDTEKKREYRMANYTVAMESIKIDYRNKETMHKRLSVQEREVLSLRNKELLVGCMKSGMLRRDKFEKYVDYAWKEKDLELAMLLIRCNRKAYKNPACEEDRQERES